MRIRRRSKLALAAVAGAAAVAVLTSLLLARLHAHAIANAEDDPNPVPAHALARIAVSLTDPIRFRRDVLDGRAFWNGRKGKVIIDPDGHGAFAGAQAGANGFFLYRPGAKPVRISPFTLRSGLEDAQAADVTGDGAPDIVGGGLDGTTFVLVNPRGRPCGDPYRCIWPLRIVDARHLSHDVVVADMDRDGANDIVTENGVYFNVDRGTTWRFAGRDRIARDGQGTSVGDLAGDGILDVVAPYAQGTQLARFVNPLHDGRDARAIRWAVDVIDPHPLFHGNMTTAVTDVNGNGRNDIVLAPMYGGGGLVWYENPGSAGGIWRRHVIDASVNFVHQGSLQIADMNGDGLSDIAFAEQDQSPTKRIGVFYKEDRHGSRWRLQVLSTEGGHNIKAGRIGDDRLPSILSARHGYFHTANPLLLFRNLGTQ